MAGKGGGSGGGAKSGGGGGVSGNGSGGVSGKGGGFGGWGMMKAPGGDGAIISRVGFEGNPQGYFAGLHAGAGAGGNSNTNK